MKRIAKLLVFPTLLAIGLTHSPAESQAGGNGRGNGAPAKASRQSGAGTLADDAFRGASDDRLGRVKGNGNAGYGNGSGKVPPGWCNGVGNPHNTVANCGYSAVGRGTGIPDRNTASSRRTYELQHEQYHRDLNEKYRRLASRRPGDLRYQLELQEAKRAEHSRWHERLGIRH